MTILITAIFLFDSLALGTVEGNAATIHLARPFLNSTLSFFQGLSFPILVIVYLGSLLDVFLASQILHHVRGKTNHGGNSE